MRNFKILAIALPFLLVACINQDDHFFESADVNAQKNEIEYHEIHQLSLSMLNLKKTIDETGFEPKLTGQFELLNKNKGPWSQAWIAFNVEFILKDKLLAQITKTGSLQNHVISVEVSQELPKFGIKPDEVFIKITPVAWMPTYPLEIHTAATEYTASEQTTSETNSEQASNE